MKGIDLNENHNWQEFKQLMKRILILSVGVIVKDPKVISRSGKEIFLIPKKKFSLVSK